MAAVTNAPLIVEDLWVQCDKCSKWRRLAPGTVVDENSNWYCWQHPDPNQKSCDTPEEAPQEGTISWKAAASLTGGGTGKGGRKRKSAPAAPVVTPAEQAAAAASKAAESNACYAILRALVEQICSTGNITHAVRKITVDDYDIVAKCCPSSAPILKDALSLYTAMAYLPDCPDLRQLLLSAVSACVLEMRPAKAE